MEVLAALDRPLGWILTASTRPDSGLKGAAITLSIKVMTWVWEHSTHKEGSLLVLLAIADIADDEGKAWPSIARIAAKARLSERQTQYILRRLETSGELSVDRGGGRHHTNVFWVNIGKGAETAPFEPETMQSTASLKRVQYRKGAVGDIERVQFGTEKGAIAIAPEPSIEPSIEPSLLNIVQNDDFPEWFKTMSQDPRWHGKDPERYIRAIEKEYPNINLDVEAHSAYEWLQSPKGMGKKVLRGFWRHWLNNVIVRPSPNNQHPIDPNESPAAAIKAWQLAHPDEDPQRGVIIQEAKEFKERAEAKQKRLQSQPSVQVPQGLP